MGEPRTSSRATKHFPPEVYCENLRKIFNTEERKMRGAMCLQSPPPDHQVDVCSGQFQPSTTRVLLFTNTNSTSMSSPIIHAGIISDQKFCKQPNDKSLRRSKQSFHGQGNIKTFILRLLSFISLNPACH